MMALPDYGGLTLVRLKSNLVPTNQSHGVQQMIGNRIAITAIGILALTWNLGLADEPSSRKSLSLLTMLGEWQYPDSKFQGAESSDAGISDITSIKSKAVLTTPDSAEKVVAFYRQKLKVDSAGKNLGEKDGERVTTKRSVSIQDDSNSRPLKLYIIAINEESSSTTLVVSRSEGEETTHITWSNFRHLRP
jgi:hypothetical protein